jgi:uncharacterized phage protein (TIGR02218 family)
MREVSWESSVGALAAFLNSTTQVYMADLFTFTLSGDVVIRYTSADVPVTVNGNTYALGPVITRGNTKLAVGISVDSLDLTLEADTSVTVNAVPLLQFIANGGLDGARLSLARAFAAGPGSAWVGSLGLFSGRLSDIQVSRYSAALAINSDSELLNVMVPRNVYQPGCGNTLFDGACGLSKAAFASAATAMSGTNTTKTVFTTDLAQADTYFALGFAVGVTGANAGVSRTVRAFAAGAIVTIQPWPQAVAIGDTFTVYPGCDKQQGTCSSKYANLSKFRGHPYIPAPETIT